MSLISDDDEHSVAAFAAATDVNQLAGVQSIAVEHRVTQCFSKGEILRLSPGRKFRVIFKKACIKPSMADGISARVEGRFSGGEGSPSPREG
jgi:hypothetical protein